MAAPTLGYWDIRGNTEAIRLVLTYAGIDFNDKRYSFVKGEEPRAQWFAEKFTLNLPFPNLPYWVEGDLKITQSTAILRHAARKAGLTAKNETEQTKLEALEQQAVDLRSAATGLFYNPQFDSLKADFAKTVPEKFQPWSQYLGENKYLTGDQVTYVDFVFWDLLQVYQKFEPTALQTFPNLKAYFERVQTLPKVEAYLKSDKFKANEYCGPIAKFLPGKAK